MAIRGISGGIYGYGEGLGNQAKMNALTAAQVKTAEYNRISSLRPDGKSPFGDTYNVASTGAGIAINPDNFLITKDGLKRAAGWSDSVSQAFDDVIMNQLSNGNETTAKLLTFLKTPAEGSADLISGIASLTLLASDSDTQSTVAGSIKNFAQNPVDVTKESWNAFTQRTWNENLASVFKLGMGAAVGVGAGKYVKISPAGGIVGEASGLSPFAKEISSVYQKYLNEGGDIVSKRLENGYYKDVSKDLLNARMGQDVDGYARDQMRLYKKSNYLGDDVLKINKYLYKPNDSAKYRIPDIQLPKERVSLDGTIGRKSLETTPQVRDFFKYGMDRVIIQMPNLPEQTITRNMYLKYLQTKGQ